MTKKHIWAKLLVVALIVAMVCAFFIGCNRDKTPSDTDDDDKTCTSHVDANKDGKCDNCGATMSSKPDVDTAAITDLLGVVDDAIAQLDIDNVGNIGTDAYIELSMVQGDETHDIRIDLDLSLDLLNDAESVYTNNAFGFSVTVDGTREFGLWYVDAGSETPEGEPVDNYFYLSSGGQNLRINAPSVASILERYEVNADVEVGSKLEGVSVTELAGSYVGMIAGFVTIDHETDGNKEIFSLNLRELFNPQGLLYGAVDSLLFGEEATILDLSSILSEMNVAISSSSALYDILPDIDLQVIGNYDSSKNFESISLGLAVGEKADGITIPAVTGDGYNLVETVPATDLSATLGYKFFSSNYDAYDNVSEAQNATIADVENWTDVGLLNFALEAQVSLGKTEATKKTYDVELSADIDLSAVADATFVKTLYYTENGVATSKDWFYLRGVGPFAEDTDLDVIDTLLPAINSLYIKMVNVEDPEDILLINLDEKITMDETGLGFETGRMTINLAAVTGILETFGLTDSIPENVSDMISKLNGSLGMATVLEAIKPVLSSFIYTKVPAGATTTAPASATSNELAMAEGEESTEPSVVEIITEVINKVMACVSIDTATSSITAEGSGADYTVGGAELTFDITASLLKGENNAVNGVKVAVDEFVSDYNNGEVVTSVNGSIQLGGGELFKAEVAVDQNKAEVDTLDIYIALTLEKIGYGCATTSPVVLGADQNPTGSIFVEGAGWSISK